MIEQEYDGMLAVFGFSEPFDCWDYSDLDQPYY